MALKAHKKRRGEVQGLPAISRDITERERVEEALRQSEERFHFMVSNVKDYAILMLDPDGRVISWNEGAERIKGYRAEEIIGRHFSCFYTKEDVERGKPAFELKTAAAQGRFEDEGWRVRKDGSRFWANVVITAFRDEKDRLRGFGKITRDFTERKRSEDKAHAAGERFRFIAEAMQQKIFTAKPNGDVDYFNQQWMEFTGLSFEQIRDWGWTQFVHPEDLDEDLRRWRHSIDTGEPYTFEHRFRRADGMYRWHLSRIHAIRDAEGKTIMWLGSSTDIDDDKQAEQVLERRVEERTAAVRQLSLKILTLQDEEHRSISRELHDSVGQHLAITKMIIARLRQAELAGEQTELLSKASHFLDICISETRTISYLLHPPLLDELGFSSAAKWYVEGFSERSGIKVNLDLSSGSHRLPRSVELPLFRVLQASLANVHRHSQSSSVDIRLEIGVREAKLEVEDYGRGISRELLDRFKITGTGAGIGLVGMRERMRELGGRLEIESDTSGTLVRAVIPVSASARAAKF